jgi:3-ketosteroid 9alpha-monooxygenase subunit B
MVATPGDPPTRQSTKVDPPGYDLRVARVIRETADACSVVLEIPPELAGVFHYRAGQFVTLRVPFQGMELSRSYSLSSSPDVDREHKITIKRIPAGRVSNWVNDCLRPGDFVRVMPPGGLFVLDDSTRPLALFAAGSGITPIISIIKSALACSERVIRLVYANRDAASVIFKDELDALAGRHGPRMTVAYHYDVEQGFLDKSRVGRDVVRLRDADFYVCGPSGFMDVVQASLDECGIPDERVRIERFVSPPDPVRTDASIPSRNGAPASVSVYLDGRTHEIMCEPGETVLAAVQRNGLEPPFSCTDGFCGCCMARLRSGKVRMIKNDFLSERELQDGWVLTCQSVPEGDGCKVEYPD